jgi:hypothetical protein
MFFLSDNTSQLNLFSNNGIFLSKSSLKVFEDDKSWHNLFREQITLRIDEEIFRPLFCEDNGAPNASIRVLVAMLILKEAQGLSDAKLFEECKFNLLTRSALSLVNIDDKIPAASTYYLFRNRIEEWEKAGNDNLMEKVFSQITKSQVAEFQINGKRIRMDSKLLSSNIAWYSRYELIHETLRKAYSDNESLFNCLLMSELDKELLNSLVNESGDKVVYRSSKSEIETRLSALGVLIYKIIGQIGEHSSESIQILCSVFKEQYSENEDIVTPRTKEEITANSIQSPHDTECTYRNKGENQFKGYSFNLTETCDDDAPLNLITHVQVDVASTADCDFLQPAVEATQEILPQEIEKINADGAYHSPENQDYCKENTRKIKTEEGKNRYFTQKEIDTCLLRKQITTRTQSELNVRNNVEAAIFQLGYHYPNSKSRYRGLIKHKIWANSRCIWVNFARIVRHIVKNGAICVQKVKNMPTLPQFLTNFIETIFLMYLVRNFSYCFPKNRFWVDVGKNDFL